MLAALAGFADKAPLHPLQHYEQVIGQPAGRCQFSGALTFHYMVLTVGADPSFTGPNRR